MTKEIEILRDQMQECAAQGFHAAERAGKGSPEHMEQYKLYVLAAKAYEDACKAAGIEPYATYDYD